jgi:hypothetical protein
MSERYAALIAVNTCGQAARNAFESGGDAELVAFIVFKFPSFLGHIELGSWLILVVRVQVLDIRVVHNLDSSYTTSSCRMRDIPVGREIFL